MPRGERNRQRTPSKGLDRSHPRVRPSLHGSDFMILKDFSEELWKILQDHGWMDGWGGAGGVTRR
jgi:hypothetical protein